MRRAGRWYALAGAGADVHDEARVVVERHADRILGDGGQRRVELEADGLTDRPCDRDRVDRRLQALRDRAVRAADEVLDAVDGERLHVGENRLDDVADDRRVAQPGGERPVETVEVDVHRRDQVDVDVRGIGAGGLERVIPVQVKRIRGEPEPA